MNNAIVLGLLIPFAGTSLGAAMVFFFSKQISDNLRKVLTGFAAGVMVASAFAGEQRRAGETVLHPRGCRFSGGYRLPAFAG